MCNLSIFIVNDFYCVINCLNMNSVTICRAKLKFLTTSCFRYNSEEKTKSFPFPKIKLNRIVSLCKFYNKMFRRFSKNDRFFKIVLSIHLESLHIHLIPSQNVSPLLLLNGVVMVINEGSIACKCFK